MSATAPETRDEVFAILDRILDRAKGKGDGFEVHLSVGREALTRFAENRIHQSVTERSRHLAVRAVIGGRTATASTNRIDDAGIDDVIERAVALAGVQETDPDLPPLTSPDGIPTRDRFDAATANATPADRAEPVAAMIEAARAEGLVASGALATRGGWRAIGNTAGLYAAHRGSVAAFSTTLTNDADGTGWASGTAGALSGLDLAALAERARVKCRLNRDPIEVPPGTYTVLLESPAVSTVVRYLGMTGFNALGVQEGRSFLCDIGDDPKRAADAVTLVDDVTRAETLSRPFDDEGIATRPVPLIERGEIRGPVYDLRTAATDGVSSTGHGLPAPNPSGPMPRALVLEPGDATHDAMLAGIERGILVTRFWYDRVVDPRRTTVTGLTRDGTFLVENGRIVKALRNLRYNESFLGILARTSAVGDTPALHGEWGRALVPDLLVDGFRFTDVSK